MYDMKELYEAGSIQEAVHLRLAHLKQILSQVAVTFWFRCVKGNSLAKN